MIEPGDRLHANMIELLPQHLCHVSFSSLLPGDHCGVDIETCAHTALLRSAGLLSQGSQLVANRPLRDRIRCQGLVIDDYFSVSIEPDGTLPGHSQAYRDYLVSQQIYLRYKLLGSPHKDILGLSSGAWVNADESTRKRGLATVSAPPQKRLGLSHVTLAVSSLTHTSDSLHLCLVGGWVSAMGYRRPMYTPSSIEHIVSWTLKALIRTTLGWFLCLDSSPRSSCWPRFCIP